MQFVTEPGASALFPFCWTLIGPAGNLHFIKLLAYGVNSEAFGSFAVVQGAECPSIHGARVHFQELLVRQFLLGSKIFVIVVSVHPCRLPTGS
jgi:hypothetical protein